MPRSGTMAKAPPAMPEGLCTARGCRNGPAPWLARFHTSLRERDFSRRACRRENDPDPFRRRRKPGRGPGPFLEFPEDGGRGRKPPFYCLLLSAAPAIRLAAKRLRRRKFSAPRLPCAKGAVTRRARRPGVPSLVPPQGVGADTYDRRPKFRSEIWLAEATAHRPAPIPL